MQHYWIRQHEVKKKQDKAVKINLSEKEKRKESAPNGEENNPKVSKLCSLQEQLFPFRVDHFSKGN